jgi:hypothetical protein
MKKLCTILLIAFILTACGGDTVYDSELILNLAEGEGGRFSIELFGDSVRRVIFTDFEALAAVPICPKPNCRHNDTSCSAVLRSGLHFGIPRILYYDGSLYHIETESKWAIVEVNGEDQQKLVHSTSIYKMDLDGTNRRELAVLEGKDTNEACVIKDGKLWLIAKEVHFDESGMGEYEHYLYTFDLRNNEFKEIANFGRGHSVFGGIFNGDMYFGMNSGEGKILRFDSASGKFVPTDLPYLSIFTEDFIIYLEDGEIYSKDKENNITHLEGMTEKLKDVWIFEHIIDNQVVGLFEAYYPIYENKVLQIYSELGWDLTTNESFWVNKEFFIEHGEIIGEHEGYYIFQNEFDVFSRAKGEEFKGEAK